MKKMRSLVSAASQLPLLLRVAVVAAVGVVVGRVVVQQRQQLCSRAMQQPPQLRHKTERLRHRLRRCLRGSSS
jgi:hypothetical protein